MDAIAPGEPVRLLFVGNDFRRKGGGFLLEVFKALPVDNYVLTIITNDPYVAGLTLPNGVTAVSGLKSAAEVRGYYRSSHVLLLPTRRDQLPNVIGEAMASGLPVIASDVGAISEILRDGESGYCLRSGETVSAWVAAIESATKVREQHHRLALGALKFAQRELSFTRFVERIGETVSSVMPRPHRNSMPIVGRTEG